MVGLDGQLLKLELVQGELEPIKQIAETNLFGSTTKFSLGPTHKNKYAMDTNYFT